jgi:site-specific DNA-methyltransferase (adenine-specific)
MSLTITNEDNLVMMARYPDNYFDLAIVDPPYGIDRNGMNMGNSVFNKDNKKWDSKIPSKQYFKELFRVSQKQIIWGGNYFPLPQSQYFAIWDKGETMYGRDFAECEYAWVSSGGTRIFKKSPNQPERIHPTQKPVALYKWLLDKYAKIKCDHKHEEHYRYLCTDCNNGNVKILDTHLGSGSIAIACHDYGFDLTACELDKEYFDKAMQRIQNHISQTKLF